MTPKFLVSCALLGLLLIKPCYGARAHGIAVWGTLKYNPNFQFLDYVNPKAPKRGRLNYGDVGTFDSLNPFIVKGTPPALIHYTFARLLEEPHDTVGEGYGWIAESVDLAPDRSWITFHLNPKAKFSDGHPITADDVIWSFETLRDHGLPFYRTYYKNVSRIEKLDSHSIRFHLNDTKNRELPFILGQIPVLPKHYFQKHPFNETYLTPPPASGPYQVTEVKAGRSLVLKRVENWWGEDVPSQKGRYNFNEIKVIYYLDANALFEGFKSGDVHFRVERSIKNWMTAYDFPAIKEGRVAKEEIKHQIPSGTTGFFFNTRRPLFQNIRVRQALTLAFNFTWVNKNLFYNAYKRSLSFYENSDFAAHGKISDDEREILKPYNSNLPPHWDQPFTLPISETPKEHRQSLLKAKTLLKEAGWQVKDGLLVDVKGQPFEFEILISDKALEKIILFYIEQLKKLGIFPKVRYVDSTTYMHRVENKDFDMIYGGIPQSNSLGNEQRDFFGSEKADLPGSYNYAGIKNAVVDHLIELLIVSETYDQLVTRSRALDRILCWNFYMIPSWHSNVVRVAYWKKLHKPKVDAKHNPVDITTWWCDEDAAKTKES